MLKKITILLLLLTVNLSWAGSPDCSGPGENLVSWPDADNPVWEMCYLRPSDSSAAQGSSLEIRDAYYNGHLVLERAHIPLLFANYATSTCYRDWKNTNSNFLQADQIIMPTQAAITTCDISTSEITPVGSCPFQDVNGGGTVGNSGDCILGVQVEKYADRLLLTTNHSAAWYKYSSRYTFFADGRIKPRFGFGNSDGTNSGITHWHHAYWRLNFDINGPDNDQVYIFDGSVETLMNNEFSDLRELNNASNDANTWDDEITWLVKDSVTGRGYRLAASFEGISQQGFVDDYYTPVNPGGDGYHNVDVMVSKYKLINGTLPEYSDTPGANNLGNCSMDEENIVGDPGDNGNLPESLVGENVVLWYRAAVEDLQNAGMLCKRGGPTLIPIGDWASDVIFKDGFE
ncbi:MAG: hypothetical protein L3J52_01565 [Proteobacteria bacterium]|nr:hypothetical protein [Pseudomonadota bacterium]